MWIPMNCITDRTDNIYIVRWFVMIWQKRPYTKGSVLWTANNVGIEVTKVNLIMKCFRKSRLWGIFKSGHNIEQKINSYNEELLWLIICWSFYRCIYYFFKEICWNNDQKYIFII